MEFILQETAASGYFFVVRLKLVELLEANHGSDFSECSSRDVEAVLSDETRSAASDSALSET